MRVWVWVRVKLRVGHTASRRRTFDPGSVPLPEPTSVATESEPKRAAVTKEMALTALGTTRSIHRTRASRSLGMTSRSD